MRKLEVQLGLRLLHHNSRQVSLTEAGAQLLAEAAPLLDQLQTALQRVQAQHDEPAGLLRINTSRLAAGLLINPRLDEFLARDMVSLPLDQGQWEAVVASPAYWQQHGMPQTPADLARHDCIRFRLPGSKRLVPWIFEVDGQTLEVETHGRLIFSDDHYVTHAAYQGYGVAHKFVGSIQPELADGRLVAALQKFERPWSGFHIYYPARKLMPPKLRVFIDFFRGPLTATPVQRP